VRTWHTLHVVTAPSSLRVPFPAVDSLAVDLLAVDLLAVGDPGRTRTVIAAILFLVALGIGLLVLAGWLVRSTRADPEVLAPLEVMGERSWRNADPVRQRRRLDEVRPDDAEPIDPMAPPPPADAEFDLGPKLAGFADFDDLLRNYGIVLEDASPDAVPEPLDDVPPPSSDPVTVEEPPTSERS
jgi:hypothetical protein